MTIDLEHIEFTKQTELKLSGWEKIKVVYTFHTYSGVSWLLWKVLGTDHVFQIPYSDVIMNHGTELEEHFSLTLKVFREDFLEWRSLDFSEPWMKKYRDMFEKLIL